MRFLDREKELAHLDRLACEGMGGFAVVWGRRRIGKLALLIEWCRRHDGLYTVADRSLPPLQREAFAAAVSARFPRFAAMVGRGFWTRCVGGSGTPSPTILSNAS